MLSSVFGSILLVVLGLSVLVIVHELGHFLVAKWVGIKTEEFGLGYPPKITKLFRRFATDFTLNWIPFGGFVRLAGDAVDYTQVEKPAKKGEFYSVSVWKRLAVVIAGVMINLIVGILIFTVVYFRLGIPQEIDTPRVREIAPNSPISQLSLQLPFEIVGFNLSGEEIKTPTIATVQEFVSKHRGQNVSIITKPVCTDANCIDTPTPKQLYIRTLQETPQNEGSLGVVFEQVVWRHYPWYEMIWRSVIYGLEEAFNLAYLILQALSQMIVDLFHGQFKDQLAGPVGIVQQVHQAQVFEAGWLARLSFVGMLSVNLALMNILPLPPLDGGKLVFTLLEWLVGKRKALRLEQIVSFGGYFLLMSLIILVTARDIWRLIV